MRRLIITVLLTAIVAAASAPGAGAVAPADKGRAVLRVTPTSLQFGKQAVGTTSIATVTITNTSDATVHLCCFLLAFDFTRGETGNMGFQPDPCGPALPEGKLLAPGASCTVSIAFQPIDQGWVVYEFCAGYLESDEPDKTDPRSCITLTGVGI